MNVWRSGITAVALTHMVPGTPGSSVPQPVSGSHYIPRFPLGTYVTLGPSTQPPHPGYTAQSLSFLSLALHPGSLCIFFFF